MYQKKGTKFYSFCLVFIPILSSYESIIHGIDLGTLIVLLFGIFAIINPAHHKLYINKRIGLLLTYVFFRTILIFVSSSTVFYSDESIVFLRTMRFIVLIIIVMGIGYKDYYDPDIFFKIYIRVSIICSLFGIIQFIAFLFLGVRIPGVLGSQLGLQTVSDAERLIISTRYRPSSFFGEPSNFAYYVIPCICHLLFDELSILSDKHRYVSVTIITAGIIATASSQGVLCVAFVWSAWILYRLKKSSNLQGIVIVLSIGIAAFFFFTTNERIQYSISRVFDSTGYNAVDARIGGYYAFQSLDLFHKIFGTGFGNYNQMIYYSSYADILFCTGFIGLILVLRIYFTFFRYGTSTQRSLVLASLLLMGGGGIYTASLLCLYWPILSNRLKYCE